MAEEYANFAVTNLTDEIDGSQTTFNVVNGENFPAANFRVVIDVEIMLCTGNTENVFTVTRGVEGTTATPHGFNATVRSPLTRGSLLNLISDNTLSQDTEVDFPEPATVGRLNFATNVPVVLRDNGAAWTIFGHTYRITRIDPDTFTAVNSANAVVTDYSGNYLIDETVASGDNAAYRVLSLNYVSDNFSYIFGYHAYILPGQTYAGIVLRDSVSALAVACVSWEDSIAVITLATPTSTPAVVKRFPRSSSAPIFVYVFGDVDALGFRILAYPDGPTVGQYFVEDFNGETFEPDQIGFIVGTLDNDSAGDTLVAMNCFYMRNQDDDTSWSPPPPPPI